MYFSSENLYLIKRAYFLFDIPRMERSEKYILSSIGSLMKSCATSKFYFILANFAALRMVSYSWQNFP